MAETLRPYILDDATTVEYQRLDLMSKILDPWTRRYLEEIGVGPGWRCLELGGGNGSVAEWLCGVVGTSGSVTSVDINTALLGLVPAQNLTVARADVRTSELPGGDYDHVTCRAMLHQIAENAPAVLGRMAAAVRPGGWLLVQEPDFHLAPTTEPAAWSDTWSAILAWGRDNGVDWFIGRHLPGMVVDAGFARPEASTDVENIRGGERGAVYFKLFFAEVRDRVLAAGGLDAATFDAATALLDDPHHWTQCWMMTAVWGRKADTPIGS